MHYLTIALPPPPLRVSATSFRLTELTRGRITSPRQLIYPDARTAGSAAAARLESATSRPGAKKDNTKQNPTTQNRQ